MSRLFKKKKYEYLIYCQYFGTVTGTECIYNEDFTDYYEFACEIFRQAALLDPDYAKVQVCPVTTAEYGAKALRPFNSRLDKSKLVEKGFRPLPDWRNALTRYLKELGV